MSNLFRETGIYAIHLTTGHLILCQIKFELNDYVVMDFPFAITPYETAEGHSSVTLKEYMPYSLESRIQVLKSSIVSISPCDEKIKKIYVKTLAGILSETVDQTETPVTTEYVHNSSSTIH